MAQGDFCIPLGGPNTGSPATSTGGMPKFTSPGNFVPMTGTPVVTVIDAEWERVVVEEPVGTPAPSQLFVVVSVTLP